MLPLNVGSSVLTKSYNKEWQELYAIGVRITLALFISNIVLWLYYEQIWGFILAPIQQLVMAKIVVLSLSAPFFRTLELIFWLSLLLCLPYFLYELSCFVIPGLHSREKSLWYFCTILFLNLFYAGQWVCWRFIIPSTINFFVDFNTGIAEPLLDFEIVVGYVLLFQKLFFFISLWPIALFLGFVAGLLPLAALQEKRGLIYVFIFTFAMLITPPDCFAQCCVAVPMLLLYEIVLAIASLIVKK